MIIRPTIIARIFGGIGNQLFQFAMGHLVAQRVGGRLRAETFEFTPTYADRLEAQLVGIPVDQIGRLAYLGVRVVDRLWREGWPHWPPLVVQGDPYRYDPTVFQIKGSAILDGYWQHHAYFTPYQDELRTFIDLEGTATGRNREFARGLQGAPAIAVHVRRGDMVTDPVAAGHHGALDASYYREGIARVRADAEVRRALVFSDDPAWCRATFADDPACEIVDWNAGPLAHNDLFLMSRCVGHVIANSTFSWWGAFLAFGRSRAVVAPKAWLRDPGRDTSGVCPPHWIRI